MDSGGQDLYATLGVARDASQEQIKSAYRKLARALHPDVNPGNRKAEERFKQVGSAFGVLGDPKKRKLYDEFGEEALRSGFDPGQASAFRQWQRRAGPLGRAGFGGGPNLEDLLGGLGGVGGKFDFGDLFGGAGGVRGASRDRPGGDVTADMAVTLRDAVLGVERELTFERPAALDAPAGKGERVRLKVKVPAGIEDGQNIRLAGQGLPGTFGKGGPGDLLIRVHVAPHPHVKRLGQDLEIEVPVTVREAMLGAKIEVPTFEGSIKLTIPAGSQTGTRLRARGRGVPAHGGERAGDLYVVLSVQVPDPKADRPAAERAAGLLDGLYPGDVRAGLRL